MAIYVNLNKNDILSLYFSFEKDKIRNYSSGTPNSNKDKNNLCTNKLDDFLQKLSLKPIDIFVYLHVELTRTRMKEVFKNKAGIYMIINRINNKFYIGSAIENRLYIRFTNHLVHNTGSKLLSKTVRKYGLYNFAFLILEYCDPNIANINREYLLNKETMYLKKFNPPYNILIIGGSSLGYRHSIATKQKMKENYSQERRNFIGNLNRNKSLSEEVREKLRIAAYNRLKMPLSVREKCGLSNNKPIIAYNVEDNTYRKESSMIKFALFLNICPKTVKRAILSGKLLKKKWIIKFDNTY